MPPLVDSRGAGYAGLSSKRQQHENEENYLHHVTHRGDGSEAIRTQREAGLATGRAGVPAEMTTHAHGIGRRPMSAQPAHTPVFRTEALSGASITVMEPPQEHRPWRGHGRLAPAQPAAGQTHLDMTLTPRASEVPGTMRSVNHGPGTFRSTIEGAAMHVTAQQPAQMASTGQGRRRMQGPPTTLAYELIHPMEATPRGALSLVCHTGLEPPDEQTPQAGLLLTRLRLGSQQGNRENGPSGALTARTYDEAHEKYREFASRNASQSVSQSVTTTLLAGSSWPTR